MSVETQKIKKSKKNRQEKKDAPKTETNPKDGDQLVKTKKKYVDQGLASLFQSSAGPVARPVKKSRESTSKTSKKQDEEAIGDDDGSASDTLEDGGVALPDTKVEEIVPKLRAGKKRKREEREDDLEARYLRKIAREEAKEQDKADAEDAAKTEANGAQETETEADAEADVDATDAAEEVVANEKDDDSSSDESSDDEPPPQHESLSKSNENSEVEKASRTVFLGNVSTEAITSKSAKKTLLRHLASFFPSVTKQDPPFKVESIRFRSTAYAVKVPKKTAFIRKELMDETTKSTNAYAVYNSKVAAREAVKHLNGTIVLDRHLRVDQVAHPAKTEHKRCVFVGNLGFVDDDSQIREEANSRKENVKQRTQAPGDVEEGLWRQFSKAGIVESVRVVRDPQTRIGKGIAYVQFKDENAVEAALLFNDLKFPPLLPRKLRVSRAKAVKRNAPPPSSAAPRTNGAGDRTLVGRASKLLGRAGASQLRKEESRDAKRQKKAPREDGSNDVIIGGHRIKAMEGHRASSKEGKAGLKFAKKKGKMVGKPQNRGAKRGEAWKKANKGS